METTKIDGFEIQLRQTDGLGSIWIVRLYRKSFIFRKLLSSDWFLDGTQAMAFVEDLRKQLNETADASSVKKRKPGWRLNPGRNH